MSQIKIVATIGPRTNSVEALRALMEAGMDVVRLNGSHADLAWHAKTIHLVRHVAPQAPILFDLPGNKIRTRQLSHEPSFHAGDTVIITTEEDYQGQEKIPVTHPTLHQEVMSGDVLFADDGSLRFSVMQVQGRDIVCCAERAGTLRSAAGIYAPSAKPCIVQLSEHDQQLIGFAKAQKLEFIGLSFVENADHVHAVRAIVNQRSPRIISKIECQRAIEHLEEIIEASDGIMIDRGDLSVETSLESIALLQKHILRAAQREAKPAIVATQMLHSMIHCPVPTKAEVTDISNAVLDGASAIMLSAETAIGEFPIEAVAVMRRIADTASAHLQQTLDGQKTLTTRYVPQAMADAISLICRELPVTKIIAITASGYAARVVASRRPRQPILAVSNDSSTVRSCHLLPGTEGIYVNVPFSRTSTDHIPHCLEALWRTGKLLDEDIVLVTHVGYPRLGNRMNAIQTHSVADLRESLGWSRRSKRRQPTRRARVHQVV